VFSARIEPTAGADQTLMDVDVDGSATRLSVWDTAGQEAFNSLIPFYARDTDVAVLVCALDEERTINNIADRWLTFVTNVHGFTKRIAVVNKIDLACDGLPAVEDVIGRIQKSADAALAVSAKTGEGIDTLFEAAGRLALAAGTAQVGSVRPKEKNSRDCC
jgi:small GTP-binding protein